MNRKLFVSIFLVLSFVIGFSAKAQDGTRIKVTIPGLIKDATYYIGNYYGDKQYIVDSAKADAKGNLLFESKEKLPPGIYFFVPPARNTYFFEFIVYEQDFSLTTDTSDYDGNMKIKGSRENELFYEYRRYLASKSKDVAPQSKRLKELNDILNPPPDTTDSEDGHDDHGKKVAKPKPQPKPRPANVDTVAIKKEMEELRAKLKVVNEEVTKFQKEFIARNQGTVVAKIFNATQEPEWKEPLKKPDGSIDSLYPWRYYRSHYLDYVDFGSTIILRTPIYNNKINYFFDKLTVMDPDSMNAAVDYVLEKARPTRELYKYTVSHLMSKFEKSKMMWGESVFVHIVNKYIIPDRAFWTEQNVFSKQDFWYPDTSLEKIIKRAKKIEPILINKIVPQLTMYDTLGKPINLHTVKGKYTLLIFWDSHCGHCKEVTPKIHEVYLKYRSKGFKVYAANIEQKKEDWLKFIREKKFEWINVQDIYHYSNFRETFDVYKTPVIYMLDENKKIVFKHLSLEQIEQFCKDQFDK